MRKEQRFNLNMSAQRMILEQMSRIHLHNLSVNQKRLNRNQTEVQSDELKRI